MEVGEIALTVISSILGSNLIRALVASWNKRKELQLKASISDEEREDSRKFLREDTLISILRTDLEAERTAHAKALARIVELEGQNRALALQVNLLRESILALYSGDMITAKALLDSSTKMHNMSASGNKEEEEEEEEEEAKSQPLPLNNNHLPITSGSMPKV